MSTLFNKRQLNAITTLPAENRRGLEQLSKYVDFEFFRPKLKKCCNYTQGGAGRPPYDVVLMFKIMIIQTFYNLSDDEMEYQLNDRLSFQRFCELDACAKIPDAKTIWLFRERIGEEGFRDLFDNFHKQMVSAGLRYSGGCIVDASFVEAPKQRNYQWENDQIKETSEPIEGWSKNKARQKDVEARWAKKGNETHHGYKQHINMDMYTKTITNVETTAANVNDVDGFVDLIEKEAVVVIADSAYLSTEKSQQLAERGVTLHAVLKRKKGQKKLSEEQSNYNHKLAKIRCRVEHVFGTIKQMGGDVVRTIGLARCKVRVLLVSCVYNMKRYCYLRRTGQL